MSDKLTPAQKSVMAAIARLIDKASTDMNTIEFRTALRCSKKICDDAIKRVRGNRCRHCGAACKPGTFWCIRCKARPSISGRGSV